MERLVSIQLDRFIHLNTTGRKVAQKRKPQYREDCNHNKEHQELKKPTHLPLPNWFSQIFRDHIWLFRKIHAIQVRVSVLGARMPRPAFELLKPVAMVGMMGAGKTAVGSALARRIGADFVDSDEELAKAADRTIAEIFERDGEAFFRARETEVLDRLMRSGAVIVSTGGGAFLSEVNRNLIAELGVALWLKADLDLLWNRVKHKTTRPLIMTDDPFKSLQEIYDARQDIYAKAGLTVRTEEVYSIEETVDVAVAALSEAGVLREKAA